MTHIRLVQSPSDPYVPPSSEEQPSKRPLPLSHALIGLAIVLTAANCVGLAYTATTLHKLSNFSRQLADAGQFEKRISDRLETFNDGIHAQFDRLNERLDTAKSDRVEPFGGNVPATHRQSWLPAGFENVPEGPGFAQVITPGRADGFVNEPTAAAAFSDAKIGTVTRMANFVRTQMPDGKIIYSMIK